MPLWLQIATNALSFLAGVGVKFAYDRSRKDSSRSQPTQSGNIVGGNLAGRDIKVGERKPE